MTRACLLLPLSLLLVALPAAARVRAEHDPQARFTDRSTFAFRQGERAEKFREEEPFLDKHLRTAIARELSAKGLRLVESGPADLVVAYRASVRQRLDVVEDDWFPRRSWWDDDVDVRSYDEITFTVDVADGPTGEPMWRGRASEPEASEGREQAQVDRLMKRLFRKYPPAP